MAHTPCQVAFGLCSVYVRAMDERNGIGAAGEDGPGPVPGHASGALDRIALHLGRIAVPGEGILRKLDALEAIAEYHEAAGAKLPHGWWTLRKRIENGEL